MSKNNWSDIENRALIKLERALKELPKTIFLYTTCSEIIACKQGISNYDLSRLMPGSINAGAFIANMHDSDSKRMKKIP